MKHINLHITGTDDFLSMTLDQKIAFLAAMAGENILITGGGGTGKSYLIKMLEKHLPGLMIAASTGIAALGVNGETLDSLLGFGPHFITPDEAREFFPALRKQFEGIRCLLLEEASMTRIDRFECLDQRLQELLHNNKPFGGLQIILCGDFCQLKPVLNKKDYSYPNYRTLFGDKIYLFESDVYDKAGFTPYVLTEYMRQGNARQRRVLRNLRMGHDIKDAVGIINEMATGTPNEHSIYLCGTNEAADRINQERYAMLPGKEQIFYGVLKNGFQKPAIDPELRLKIGARVMICANSKDGGYRNGDRGTVLRFTSLGALVNLDRGSTVEVSVFEWTQKRPSTEKDEIPSYSQLPIRLAYAITIHKSQGLTLDDVVLDLSSRMWDDFQAYVGLSRIRDFSRLCLTRPLRVSDIKFNKKAIDFTREVSMAALNRRQSDLARFKLAA